MSKLLSVIYRVDKGQVGFDIGKFIRQETFGGFLLLISAIIAVVWANSSYYDWYHYIWHEVPLGISVGTWSLSGELHYWVNDGLMAVFFFVIGLEIKREILAGELTSFRSAVFPVSAAIGGMIFPALIFALINYNHPENIHGWGIPMATDIAFALGIIALLGKRVDPKLKVFLTALAIADDLGSIIVIALFYSNGIDLFEILNASGFLIVLGLMNAMGVRKSTIYAFVGFAGVWLSFAYSGVHSTLAGVCVAMTIPTKPRITGKHFINKLRELFDKSTFSTKEEIQFYTSEEIRTLEEVTELTRDAESPSQKLEHVLHPVSSFIILPLFALGNAGVHFNHSIGELLLHPVALGVALGLIFGKFIGISLLTRFLAYINVISLPKGIKIKQLYGVALLAGIGFTMSIFISDLAFMDNELVEVAKVGVFTGSIISAILGLTVLRFNS